MPVLALLAIVIWPHGFGGESHRWTLLCGRPGDASMVKATCTAPKASNPQLAIPTFTSKPLAGPNQIGLLHHVSQVQRLFEQISYRAACQRRIVLDRLDLLLGKIRRRDQFHGLERNIAEAAISYQLSVRNLVGGDGLAESSQLRPDSYSLVFFLISILSRLIF